LASFFRFADSISILHGKEPPVLTGELLKERFGISKGPLVGKMLDFAYDYQLRNEEKNPKELLDVISKHFLGDSL
jgi:hypothetical protein